MKTNNNQRLAEAMAKTWTFTGQDKNELRRLRTEVEADLGQVDGNQQEEWCREVCTLVC